MQNTYSSAKETAGSSSDAFEYQATDRDDAGSMQNAYSDDCSSAEEAAGSNSDAFENQATDRDDAGSKQYAYSDDRSGKQQRQRRGGLGRRRGRGLAGTHGEDRRGYAGL
jgi:hypothetical protein